MPPIRCAATKWLCTKGLAQSAEWSCFRSLSSRLMQPPCTTPTRLFKRLWKTPKSRFLTGWSRFGMTRIKGLMARLKSCPSQNMQWREFFRSLLNCQEGATMSSSSIKKTRGHWHVEWPARGPRAFVRRASTHLGVLGPHRKPLDPFVQAAGVSVRISDALRVGRARSSHLPHQHDGYAYS